MRDAEGYWIRIDLVVEEHASVLVFEQEFLVGPFASLEQATAAWWQKVSEDDGKSPDQQPPRG